MFTRQHSEKMAFLVFCIFFLTIFTGCSGFEKSEQRSIRRVNAQGEKIQRFDHEHYFSFEFPEKKERELYSWERRSK